MFDNIVDDGPSGDSPPPQLHPQRAAQPSVAQLCALTAQVIDALEPDRISTDTAAGLLRQFSELERLAGAAAARCAHRAAEGPHWKDAGARSAAHWVGDLTATSPGAARRKLEGVRQLSAHPECEAALATGELSSAQIELLGPAVDEAPDQADALLRTAREGTLAELRERCRAARAHAHGPKAEDDAEKKHRRRRLQRRTTADGLEAITLAGTADDVAHLGAAIDAFRDAAWEDANARGDEAPGVGAIGFDAALLLARHALDAIRPRTTADAPADEPMRAAGPGAAHPEPGERTAAPQHTSGARRFPRRAPELVVRVDLAALQRGYALPGEICEITGTGPTTVGAIVRLLGGGARLVAVHTDAHGSVVRVAHRRRGPRRSHSPTDACAADRSPPWWLEVTVIIGVPAGADCMPTDPDEGEPASRARAREAVEVLDSKGVDVGRLVRDRRAPSAHQRSALRWRDPTCRVAGCTATARLEIDHHVDWAHAHRTTLDELGHLCTHHHRLRTVFGWQLEPGPGKRPLVPPSARGADPPPE